MATPQSPTDLLLAIVAELKTLNATMEHILGLTEERMKRTAPAQKTPAANAAPNADPEIKAKDPKDWTGETMKGRRFSECPPEYLDLLADRYDYFAGKETDPTKAGYNRKDANLARLWAVKIRNGWKSERVSTTVVSNVNPFVEDDGGINF